MENHMLLFVYDTRFWFQNESEYVNGSNREWNFGFSSEFQMYYEVGGKVHIYVHIIYVMCEHVGTLVS